MRADLKENQLSKMRCLPQVSPLLGYPGGFFSQGSLEAQYS